jgi:N-acetylneuraminic acid mutarotase
MQAVLGLSCIDRLRVPAAIFFLLALSSLLILSSPTPGETAGWRATGSLATGRCYHTASLLPNGKVLVTAGFMAFDGFGGFNYAALDSTELYDPVTGKWSAAGLLAITTRGGHTATLLPNGKVLVAGGANTIGYLASAEVYEPATGYWDATGSLAAPRMMHTATLLNNGKVLVAGGYNPSSHSLAGAELYDPVSGTWSATGPLAAARAEHSATLLPDGQVLVAGGFHEELVNGSYQRTYLNTAELYDPVSGTWSATGSLAAARSEHSATLLRNGQVLVVAGVNGSTTLQTAQLYDPVTGTWHTTGSLAATRADHTATLLPNGQVLVVGGYNKYPLGVGYLGSPERYDPLTGKWSTAGALGTLGQSHTATLLPNGQVLVAGGGLAVGGYGSLVLTAAELYQNAASLGPLELLLLGN